MRDIYTYTLPQNISNKKIIIYGTDTDAKQFALRLLNANISFHFFLHTVESKIKTANIYNRKVISISEIDQKCSVIITSHKNYLYAKTQLAKWNLDAYLIELETLHPDLFRQDIIIYGTGELGKKAYEHLHSHLNIIAFSDSAEARQNTCYMGKKVIAPENISEKCAVLIASSYYNEIEETLHKCHIADNNIWGDLNLLLYKNSFLLYHKDTFGTLGCMYGFDLAFTVMQHDYKECGITLYGEKECTKQALQRLRLLGFTNINVISRDTMYEDGTVYTLAYNKADTKYLLLDKCSISLMNSIEQTGLGLQNFYWCENYAPLYDLSFQYRHHDFIDPTLGFATISEESLYPGFIKYEFLEGPSDTPIRIVTLGGSTTSAHCVRNRPWSYFLSEKLRKLHISHIIYCGGNDSYSVSQELLRLVRDGLLLKPDFVISYSGANNVAGSFSVLTGHPFLHTFQEDLFDSIRKISSIQAKVTTGFYAEKKINYGIESGQTNAQYWYEQLKIMNGICSSMNVQFFSFLQPMLFAKSNYMEEEINLLASYEIFIDEATNKLIATQETAQNKLASVQDFMLEAKNISEKWFYDLSGILDDTHNVYMDNCHLYENGNKIIAEHIGNKILLSIND